MGQRVGKVFERHFTLFLDLIRNPQNAVNIDVESKRLLFAIGRRRQKYSVFSLFREREAKTIIGG